MLHQVVTAQLAAKRSGTQSTRRAPRCAAAARKPYRQKGTGNARQGSTRSPNMSGGGVAFAPKPRSYAQRTPKKMIRLALHSALSDRASESRVALLDAFGWEHPARRTRWSSSARSASRARVLVVLSRTDVAAETFATSPASIDAGELNAYDVLAHDWCCSRTRRCRTEDARVAARRGRRRRVAAPCGGAVRRGRRDRRRGADGAARRGRGGGRLMRESMSVLHRPVVSEKTYALMDAGVYVFVVDSDATKIDVRHAVEQAFGVKVAKVNTMNRKGKTQAEPPDEPHRAAPGHQARARHPRRGQQDRPVRGVRS